MQVVAPDERALRAALASPAFRSGVDGERWCLVSLTWPIGIFAVSAAPRPGAPNEYGLRINLSGYPQQAPTAAPWDLSLGAPLARSRRPTGVRVGKVFYNQNWQEDNALYAPWDRTALEGHSNWPQDYPEDVWHPGRDIAFLLGRVHELLNADDYTGV